MGILDSVHQESFSSKILHAFKNTFENPRNSTTIPPQKRHDFEAGATQIPAGPWFSLTLHLTNKRRRLRTEELLKHLLKRLTFTGHLDPPRSSSPKNCKSSLTTRPFKGKTTTWWNLNQKKLQVGETSGITQKANRGFFSLFFSNTSKKTSHPSTGIYQQKVTKEPKKHKDFDSM